ncbi:succinate--CoA ligase subunit alpha [Thermodesulfobacteriota bacterium]
MAILIDENTRLIVHGITGREGSFHTRTMIDYGTKVVAGVVPGKGGKKLDDIPIYSTAREARDETEGNTSIIFVPKQFALGAVIEALEASIPLIICVTEGIPVRDVLKMKEMQKRGTSTLIGPNTPGVISPGKAKVGGMPDKVYMPGSIGIVSRSGTLSYEVVNILTESGLGQSTCVGIGGDMIPCLSFVGALERFAEDKETEMIVLIGEVGGIGEIEAAKHIKEKLSMPMFALIGGLNAPQGKKMGHAGAIVSTERTTASAKIEAFENAGVSVVKSPFDLRDAILARV